MESIGLGDAASLIISEELIPQPDSKPSNIVSLSFSNLLHPALRLQTNQKECGGQLWPAGIVLAEYLLQEKRKELRSKTMFVRLHRTCDQCLVR